MIINQVRTRLFWKVAIYYGTFFALIIVVAVYQPQLFRFLPFGGMEALQGAIPLANDIDVLPELLDTRPPESFFRDQVNLITALAGVLVIMIPARWVYMTEGLKKSRNSEIAGNLLVLPLVVTTIIYVVKYSLPLAFALTGIFAGVRYRTNLKSQSDASFTFFSIAVGLSAGTRTLGIGLVLAAFFALTIIATPPALDELEK